MDNDERAALKARIAALEDALKEKTSLADARSQVLSLLQATLEATADGLTGVDSHVAGALLRAARAVRLLGAEVVLTGIRAEVAQTLVGLGLDLGGLVTRGTLQAGIAYALGPRPRKQSAARTP